MRKSLIVIATIVVTFSGLLIHAQTRPVLLTYKSAQHGFQMDYLSNWAPEAGDKPWVVVRFAPASPTDQRISRVIIGVPPIPAPPPGQSMKLDTIATVMIAEMRTIIPDAKNDVAAASTLGGEPAWRMVMTGTSLGDVKIPMRSLIIATIHNNRPYVVGVVAPQDEWDRMRDGFDRLVKSFTFTEPTK